MKPKDRMFQTNGCLPVRIQLKYDWSLIFSWNQRKIKTTTTNYLLTGTPRMATVPENTTIFLKTVELTKPI